MNDDNTNDARLEVPSTVKGLFASLIIFLLPVFTLIYYVIVLLFTEPFLEKLLKIKINKETLLIDESGKTLTLSEFLNVTGNAGNAEELWNAIWKQLRNYLRLRSLLFFVIFTGILVVLIFSFIYKISLRGTNDVMAITIIVCIVSATVGAMMLCCQIPSFVKIFENTVGYMLVTTVLYSTLTSQKEMATYKLSFDSLIKGIFTTETNPQIDDLRDYNFLFTLFRIDNFGAMLNSMKKAQDKFDFKFNMAPTDNNKEDKKQGIEELLKHLFRLSFAKHIAGFLSWMLFASIAASLISTRILSQNM